MKTHIKYLFTGFLPKAATLLILCALCASVAILSGCAFVRVSDPATGKTVINAAIPAYPWQDVNRTLRGIALTSRTNYTHATLTGLDEQTATSTNATAMLSDIAGAVVGAAIKAAK